MKLEVWVKSDKGLRRESNQDSFLINPDLGLFVVADGMGGHSGGEVASSLAVKTVEEFVSEESGRMEPRKLVAKAYEKASHKIFDHAQKVEPNLTGMGTTMVVLYYQDGYLYIGNVGDSRAYLFRQPNLWQVTEDHSLVNEQLRAGLLTEQQAENFYGRNVITRSVGYEREVDPDVYERKLEDGDAFLVCSDGLSGLVDDKDIADIMSRHQAESVVDACVERALANGGDDNVTVLYLKVRS